MRCDSPWPDIPLWKWNLCSEVIRLNDGASTMEGSGETFLSCEVFPDGPMKGGLM